VVLLLRRVVYVLSGGRRGVVTVMSVVLRRRRLVVLRVGLRRLWLGERRRCLRLSGSMKLAEDGGEVVLASEHAGAGGRRLSKRDRVEDGMIGGDVGTELHLPRLVVLASVGAGLGWAVGGRIRGSIDSHERRLAEGLDIALFRFRLLAILVEVVRCRDSNSCKRMGRSALL
jgi:hypothetical protein